MKAIIDGRTYNTETAQEICDLPCDYYSSDFAFHQTTLYLSKKGKFFIAGRGGPRSMWSQCTGNGWSGGSGIKLVSVNDARRYMESAGCDEADFEACGLTVEEG